MQEINLRDLYPDVYKEDMLVKVSEDVLAVITADHRADAAHERQMYRYKAHYSLDCDNGIEKAAIAYIYPGGTFGGKAATRGAVCCGDVPARKAGKACLCAFLPGYDGEENCRC